MIKKRKGQASRNNKSTGVLGVRRTISTDKRKGCSYLVFQVAWRDYNGKGHNKVFRAYNIKAPDKSMETRAFNAAKDFRKSWEQHCDNDNLGNFNSRLFLNWRNESKYYV